MGQTGYCVKCRTKREMKNVTKKVVGNRVQVKGVCSKMRNKHVYVRCKIN